MTKKQKEETTDLATVDEPTYAIMQMNSQELAEIIHENLGGDQLSADDLVRVPLPSQGVTTFVIPSIDGEEETKEITGVIVFTQTTRAYWPQSFDETGGNTPPDCSSTDGLTGVGNPGGSCLACPLSKFGSGKNDRAKACSEKRQIFLFRENDVLPMMIAAPPGSLKPARQYLTGLTGARKFLYEVYTKITLEPDKNQDGIKFSKLKFQKVGDVEEPAKTKLLAESLKPYLVQAAAAAATDYTSD